MTPLRTALVKPVLWPMAALLAALLMALAGGLWLWSGSATSLASVVGQLSRALPAGQTLQARDITGSVRTGGQIGWLRWSAGDISVEARDVRVSWSMAALLHQELRLSELAIGHLRIEDKRTPVPNEPPAPPASLRLPLRVDAAVSVATVEWVGSTSQTVTNLSAHYIFDSYSHRLDKGQVHISSGIYELSGTLQAQAPLALALHMSGVVQTTVPSGKQALSVAAQAMLSGVLAGADARLALQATLIPTLAGTATQNTGKQPIRQAMQASLSAELAPWQSQKILKAQGQWQALDLAALWPQAPQTRLAGSASVTPAGTGWLAHIALDNTLGGPWNQQRLPLQTLNARLEFASDQWLVQSLQATGAGGRLVGSGQRSDGLWRGMATVQGIDPAAIDSRLASVAMSGDVRAQQTATGMGFEAGLQATPGKTARANVSSASKTLQVLRLQSLSAKGVWAAPLLTLEALRIEAQDAQLQGQLSYQTLSQAVRGKLSLSLPGLQSTLDGQLASADGKGAWTLQVTDAALATGWLARWPSLASAFKGGSLRGSAELAAQWRGGWQHEAQDLHMEARLRAPRLDWRSTSTPNLSDWHVRDLQADLTGTPASMALTAQGLAETGTQQLNWQTRANMGRLKAGSWQASIPDLRLGLQDSTRQGALWSLQWGGAPDASSKPVTLNWQQSGGHNALLVSGGTARLQGPAPGVASLTWQPARWSQATSQASAPSQWQSQGRVTGLPLAWLDAIGKKTMAELGLSSDMLLSGVWEASQTDTLRAQVTLERSAGDLRLHTQDSRQPALPAGMREAWMQVNLDRGALAASLRWDSARAGKALLAFSTQLQTKDSGWSWPGSAPLGGSLQMQLPPVDAWSALAPPGWRLRGTMNANMALTGTLDTPHWSGTLQARNLALRSVVDGIDFSEGSLNARLHDQQIDIEHFTLQGAGGSAGKSATTGGQISLSGSVFWLPGIAGANLTSRLHMVLVAQAKALRLSSHPDRRVVLSGKLNADLSDTRLTLRGALTVDQALFTLPDDSAPQLGDDVLVRAPAPQGPAAPSTSAAKAGASTRPRVVPDVLVELDLGPDFQVRGRGLDTRLAGTLTLRAKDTALPSLSGIVRTVGGTYRAYGQRLEIERGVLQFSGPLDNPALTILAIRPKLTQRVGVQITGTALSPIIRLYAEPNLPDAEKLAWLVLGRSASGGGAEAALMQQAALALLGGNGQSLSGSLAQALGLDELSFSGNNTSETGASAASITLGKRLSSDFYVAYESSLVGAMGVFSIFYDLSKNLTLRARTGEQSAIDLIYTLRYD